MKIKWMLAIILCTTCLATPADHSWQIVKVSDIERGISQLFFIDESTGWACQSLDSVFRTDDGGETWRELKSNFRSVYINRVSFIDRNHGWAVGLSGDTAGHYGVILQTDDGGSTWGIKKYLREDAYLNDIYFYDADHGWAVGFENGHIGIIYSTYDKGENWTKYDREFSDVVLDSVQFADEKHGWILGNTGLVLKTNDGGKTWTSQRTIDNSPSIGLCVVNAETIWLSGGRGRLIFTLNGGTTWEKAPIPTDPETVFLDKVAFADSQNGWVSGEKGILLTTKNGGRTWESETLPTNDALSDFVITKSTVYVVGLSSRIFMRSRN